MNQKNESARKAVSAFSVENALNPSDPLVKAAVDVAVRRRKFVALLELITTDVPSASRTRAVAAAVRALTKKEEDKENRERVAEANGVNLLVSLLSSDDNETVEHAVTAILNLCLNEFIIELVFALEGAIQSIVNVVRAGSPTSKENAAATLFALADTPEHQLIIGETDSIKPLIDLLEFGTLRGQKDSLLALYRLSFHPVCRGVMIREGVVKALITRLRSAESSMEEKVVAVLSNLVKSSGGTGALLEEEGAIHLLVDTAESGSARGKEDAATALLSLVRRSPFAMSELLRDPPDLTFSKLSLQGTAVARAKATALLDKLKMARGNVVQSSDTKSFSFTPSFSQSFHRTFCDDDDDDEDE